MHWTDQQIEQARREYARIGIADGELIPTPRRELSPRQYLELMAGIPTGAGAAGWHDALRALGAA
jgi:hypothetical protein